MLVVTLSDGFEIEWHVGEKWPTIWQPGNPHAPRRTVEEIQADGHELEEILTKFDGIPSVKSGVVMVWPNPWAQFIFLNMW